MRTRLFSDDTKLMNPRDLEELGKSANLNTTATYKIMVLCHFRVNQVSSAEGF